jgi:hypothetical protein
MPLIQKPGTQIHACPTADATTPPLRRPGARYLTEMDLFIPLYAAIVSAFIAWGAPLLDGAVRRILFGLSAGVIAAAALPFVRAWLGY